MIGRLGGTSLKLLHPHLLHYHILIRTIVAPAWQRSDPVDYILAFRDLADNCVLAGELHGRRDRDEKLRAIGVWSGASSLGMTSANLRGHE